MEGKDGYFMIRQKAVPETLLRVVEVKRLLETEHTITVQEAANKMRINRNSFYKYKDDIFSFYNNTKGKTITLVVQMGDKQRLFNDLLHVVAVHRANTLTIHQSAPVNGMTTLTLSMEVRDNTDNVSNMVDELGVLDGIHYVKILTREQRCLKDKNEV